MYPSLVVAGLRYALLVVGGVRDLLRHLQAALRPGAVGVALRYLIVHLVRDLHRRQ
jgi:hypothetical protein